VPLDLGLFKILLDSVGVVLTEQPPPQPPTPPAGGYPPPPGEARRQWAEAHQATGTLPKDAYTSWIRRVGAFVIDQILFLIVAVILAFVRLELVARTGGSSCRINETTGHVSCRWVRAVAIPRSLKQKRVAWEAASTLLAFFCRRSAPWRGTGIRTYTAS
jgi:hypothetical protein